MWHKDGTLCSYTPATKINDLETVVDTDTSENANEIENPTPRVTTRNYFRQRTLEQFQNGINTERSSGYKQTKIKNKIKLVRECVV